MNSDDTITIAKNFSHRSESSVLSRWGIVAGAGYQPVPNVLIFNQKALGLKSEDLNVLLNIAAHWYYEDKMPYPNQTTIAKQMGVSIRTIQRSIERLQKLDFIKKFTNENGRKAFDMKPLITKLTPYANKIMEEKENRKRYEQE